VRPLEMGAAVFAGLRSSSRPEPEETETRRLFLIVGGGEAFCGSTEAGRYKDLSLPSISI
jgi:hypothetical protein